MPPTLEVATNDTKVPKKKKVAAGVLLKAHRAKQQREAEEVIATRKELVRLVDALIERATPLSQARLLLTEANWKEAEQCAAEAQNLIFGGNGEHLHSFVTIHSECNRVTCEL